MAKESESKANNQAPSSLSFYLRFNINVPLEEAKRKFINRVLNDLDSNFPQLEDWGEDKYDYSDWADINSYIAQKLGKRYTKYSFIEYADTDNFIEFLRALEALHEAFDQLYMDGRPRILSQIIKDELETSEVDLGVEWQTGRFLPSGAKLLDEALVNDNLRWLSKPKYTSVREAFEKGLCHLMEAKNKPESLNDVVAEMYKALEALAKVVLGNEKDLSANRQAFVDKLNLSDYYKRMLREYIEYANKFSRHAPGLGTTRSKLLPNEVEAFVYATGLFVRLSLQQLAASEPSA